MEQGKTIGEVRDQLAREGSSTVFDEVYERIAHSADLNIFLGTYEKREGRGEGELADIPYAVKDNILVGGERAGAASRILEGYRAPYSAHVIELLDRAGAIPVGRTNMDEMAMGSSTENSAYGPTKNPVAPDRVPGGSSGGSAAAVAAGIVPFALGSDTGGSIRQPAALCGVVGLKPSYGAVSRRGLIAMASSLDVIGPLTQSVGDARTVFRIISKHDPLDATSIPEEEREKIRARRKRKGGRRIGIPRAFVDRGEIHPEVKENFFATIEMLKEKGYELVDIEFPLLEHALAMYYIIQPAEVSSNLARYDGIRYGLSVEGEDFWDSYERTRSGGFGTEVKRRIMLGTYVLSSGYHDAYYRRAQDARRELTRKMRAMFEDVDFIATPTSPSPAFRIGEKQDPLSLYLEDLFTVPYNLTGNPAISVPSGETREGLPIGMHFAAPLFHEEELFEVASDFESLMRERE